MRWHYYSAFLKLSWWKELVEHDISSGIRPNTKQVNTTYCNKKWRLSLVTANKSNLLEAISSFSDYIYVMCLIP